MNLRSKKKLVFKLEEVSRMVQLGPEVINRWAQEFPFLHAGLTAKGQKVFRQQDVDIIRRLKELLFEEKLTLAGAKRKIEEEFGFKEKVAIHPDKLKKTLIEVKDRLQEIREILEKNRRKR